MRVLVVDDDEAIRVVLRLMLELEGYEVATASSGAMGLEAALEEPYDVVLLDVMMPNMDGPTVARLLREDPRTVALPIVFVSAVEPTDELTALADGFVSKPFDDERLLATIQTAMAQRAASGQPRSGS